MSEPEAPTNETGVASEEVVASSLQRDSDPVDVEEVAAEESQPAAEAAPPQTEVIAAAEVNAEVRASPKAQDHQTHDDKGEKSAAKLLDKVAEQRSSAAGGSWGWGGWLSTAVHSITETTTQMVREFVEDIESPGDAQQQPQQRQDRQQQPHADDANESKSEEAPSVVAADGAEASHQAQPSSSSDAGAAAAHAPELADVAHAIEGAEEKFFAAMDTGFSMIGKLWTQAVQVEQTVQSKASELAHKAKHVAAHASEKAQQVGERVVLNSVDALEVMGKTAFDILTVRDEASGEEKPRVRPVFMPQGPGQQHVETLAGDDGNLEELLRRNYFEDFNGVYYLQALENLSIEYTLKLQKFQAKFPPQERQQQNELASKLKAVFDADEDAPADEAERPLPDVVLSEKARHQRDILDELTKECRARSRQILQLFKHDLENVLPAAADEEGAGEASVLCSDIASLGLSYIDKLLLEGVKRLAHLSAASVEQVLAVMQGVAQAQPPSDDVVADALKKASFVLQLCQHLINEVSTTASAYIDCMEELVQAAKQPVLQLAARAKQEEQGQKSVEELSAKLNSSMNHLNSDASNGISNIQDCKKYLLPICKALVILAQIPPGGVPPSPLLTKSSSDNAAAAAAPGAGAAEQPSPQLQRAAAQPKQQQQQQQHAAPESAVQAESSSASDEVAEPAVELPSAAAEPAAEADSEGAAAESESSAAAAAEEPASE